MQIVRLAVGPIQANCYILVSNTKDQAHPNPDPPLEAIIIDPGAQGERIYDQLKELGANLRLIVNTHGHVDHIGGNAFLKRMTGARIAIHRLDAPALTDPAVNLGAFLLHDNDVASRGDSLAVSPPCDLCLEEGDELLFGSDSLAVIHTPGHTPGSICLLHRDPEGKAVLFTGDTLFRDGVGRTDFVGGDDEKLYRSIHDKLFVLANDTIIYPGHGPESTIGREMAHWSGR